MQGLMARKYKRHDFVNLSGLYDFVQRKLRDESDPDQDDGEENLKGDKKIQQHTRTAAEIPSTKALKSPWGASVNWGNLYLVL